MISATEISPWRTWGNTSNVRLGPVNASTQTVQPQQLVNVTYDRPDTWSWFFAAKITGDLSSFFNLGANPICTWDVTFGVGRSNIRVEGFATMTFSASTLNSGSSQFVALANVSSGGNGINPGVDPSPLGDTVRVDLRDIPAQSIQITANLLFPNITGAVDAEFTAFASPRSHFRPEWLDDGASEWTRPL